MDTKLIKMCEKAVEIQERWRKKLIENPRYADIYCEYVCGELIGPMFKADKVPVPAENVREFKPFWLPTQAQLQEILKDKYAWYDKEKGDFPSIYHAMIWDFSAFIQSEKFTSMEQLWLAFVMFKKYNKTWNREEWELCQ